VLEPAVLLLAVLERLAPESIWSTLARNLGIARNVLAARLKALVADGLLASGAATGPPRVVRVRPYRGWPRSLWRDRGDPALGGRPSSGSPCEPHRELLVKDAAAPVGLDHRSMPSPVAKAKRRMSSVRCHRLNVVLPVAAKPAVSAVI